MGKSDKVCQEYRYATWRHVFEVNDEMQIIFHKHHSSHDVMYHVFVLEKTFENFEPKVFTENFEPIVFTENFEPKVFTENFEPKVFTENFETKVFTENFDFKFQKSFLC